METFGISKDLEYHFVTSGILGQSESEEIYAQPATGALTPAPQ
jgi:hypothetical protein